MNMQKSQEIGFTQERLRGGAILGTIAHAVWVARQPLLPAAQSWDGQNYLLDNSSGTIATVTFGNRDIFAAFFDAKSQRNPFVSGEGYTIDPYLDSVPVELLSLARSETLEFMIQEYNGADMPIITASFWSVGHNLVAAEPWVDVRENGGHILRIQLMDDENALAEWRKELQLSAQQIDLVRTLYERKRVNPDVRFTLADTEKRVLAPERGEVECREIFASIGIDF